MENLPVLCPWTVGYPAGTQPQAFLPTWWGGKSLPPRRPAAFRSQSPPPNLSTPCACRRICAISSNLAVLLNRRADGGTGSLGDSRSSPPAGRLPGWGLTQAACLQICFLLLIAMPKGAGKSALLHGSLSAADANSDLGVGVCQPHHGAVSRFPISELS